MQLPRPQSPGTLRQCDGNPPFPTPVGAEPCPATGSSLGSSAPACRSLWCPFTPFQHRFSGARGHRPQGSSSARTYGFARHLSHFVLCKCIVINIPYEQYIQAIHERSLAMAPSFVLKALGMQVPKPQSPGAVLQWEENAPRPAPPAPVGAQPNPATLGGSAPACWDHRTLIYVDVTMSTLLVHLVLLRTLCLQLPRPQSPGSLRQSDEHPHCPAPRPPSAPNSSKQPVRPWEALRQHVAASDIPARLSSTGLAVQEDTGPKAALRHALAASNASRSACQTPEVLHWVYPPHVKLRTERHRQARQVGHMELDKERVRLFRLHGLF